MATLQQVRLENYGHRNASDDVPLGWEVTLPAHAAVTATLPRAADVRAALSGLLPVGSPRLLVLLACGPAACAACRALLHDAREASAGVVLPLEPPVGLRSPRAREMRAWRCHLAGGDGCGSGSGAQVLLVCAPAADGDVPVSGPWLPPASPQEQGWLKPLLLALAPSANALVVVDVRAPPRERLPLPDSDSVHVAGGGAVSSVEAVGLTLRWPGARLLLGSVTPMVGDRLLPRVPLRCLPPPAHLDGCLAAAFTVVYAQAELASTPVAALRVLAPTAELGGVGVAAALAATVLLSVHGVGAAEELLRLPEDFAGAHAQMARAIGGRGLAGSALMS